MRNLNLLLWLVALALIGCSAGGGDSASTGPKWLKVKYQNGAASGLGVLKAQSALAEENVPIFFTSMDIRAYQFGERTYTWQNGDTFEDDCTWSTLPDMRPWNMVRRGYGGSMDFLLPNGGDLDMNQMALRSNNGNDLFEGVELEARCGYTYSLDFLMVHAEAGPVNPLGWVWSDNGSVDASRFPDLLFPGQRRDILSSFDNLNHNFLRVIFARKDWFPTPMSLYIGQTFNGGWTSNCFSASAALSDFQAEMLTLILKQNPGQFGDTDVPYDANCLATNTAYHYGQHIVIPYDSEVPVVQFKEEAVPQPPLITEDGEAVPQPPSMVIGSSIEAVVSFNLKPSMFVNYDVFTGQRAPNPGEKLTLNPDANGTLFGISIDFRALEPAIVGGVEVQ